jgi:uncharacterized protein
LTGRRGQVVRDRIQQIESYVRQSMGTPMVPDSIIAHDIKHVDRVRGWAIRIARGEAIQDLELVEAAALLHDIGLTRVEVEQRSQHGTVGAEIATQFLRHHELFSEGEIDVIAAAIRRHNSPCGGGRLGEVLRDADRLDALGAVGIMRAFTSRYALPEYAPQDVKGDTWEMTMRGFEERFAQGKGIGDHIVDQVNFQISFYGELHTETAKRIGKPLVELMQTYVIQLESETNPAQIGKR